MPNKDRGGYKRIPSQGCDDLDYTLGKHLAVNAHAIIHSSLLLWLYSSCGQEKS